MTSPRTRERLIKRLMENGISNAGVLDAVRNVPRHMFVQEALASRAYEDDALPIGFGQTISQPLIVALMTQALLEEPDGSLRKMKKVLEIGTGCGYQSVEIRHFSKKSKGSFRKRKRNTSFSRASRSHFLK